MPALTEKEVPEIYQRIGVAGGSFTGPYGTKYESGLDYHSWENKYD